MARYSVAFPNMTTGAGVADTTALTDLQHISIQGGSATQQIRINEVQCGGEASSAAVQNMVLGRSAVVAVTAVTSVGMGMAAMDGTTTAPTAALFSNASTTKSQRLAVASAGHLLRQSFNAFGGLVRWQARQGEEITTIGASANFGEVNYSAGNGAGQTSSQVSTHIIMEIV